MNMLKNRTNARNRKPLKCVCVLLAIGVTAGPMVASGIACFKTLPGLSACTPYVQHTYTCSNGTTNWTCADDIFDQDCTSQGTATTGQIAAGSYWATCKIVRKQCGANPYECPEVNTEEFQKYCEKATGEGCPRGGGGGGVFEVPE